MTKSVRSWRERSWKTELQKSMAVELKMEVVEVCVKFFRRNVETQLLVPALQIVQGKSTEPERKVCAASKSVGWDKIIKPSDRLQPSNL